MQLNGPEADSLQLSLFVICWIATLQTSTSRSCLHHNLMHEHKEFGLIHLHFHCYYCAHSAVPLRGFLNYYFRPVWGLLELGHTLSVPVCITAT